MGSKIQIGDYTIERDATGKLWLYKFSLQTKEVTPEIQAELEEALKNILNK